MSVSLAGVPTPQRSVVEFGTATAYANTYDGKAYQGQLMSIIGTPLITAAQATLNFVVAAARVVAACAVAVFNFFGSVIGATITATAAVVAAAVDNTVNGFRIIVEYTTQQFDGVSAGQLDQVTKEGQVRIDDAGNVILIRIDGGKIIGAVAKAIGDGVVRVGNVLARSVQLPVGSWDQLIGEGYGNFCGPTTFSLDYNPVDELDTSCFIHDWCVPQKDISSDRLWTIPFSRIKSVKTCNEQLMENSSNSDCELPIDSWIGTAIPEPIEGRYKLPVGSWSDSHGNWHNPAIQVQEMTTGALSPCNRNREAILDGFGFGHAIATMPTVIV
jgi:hypothetical protein